MATNEGFRAAAASTSGSSPWHGPFKPAPCACCNTPRSNSGPRYNTLLAQNCDRHWAEFPPQAKSFILNSPCRIALGSLFDFWSAPQHVHYTRGSAAVNTYSAAWHLALLHLDMGMVREARALTINGSFIHQCHNSSIEKLDAVLASDSDEMTLMQLERLMPLFTRGSNTIQSPQTMVKYIRAHLPKINSNMMTSHGTFTPTSIKGYVGQISDDWYSTSPAKKVKQPSMILGNSAQIKIVFVDDANDDEKHSFDIGSSITLKSLFNDYSDRRGISLRSLRFSFAGKALFLSSAGHKTPEELGWKDGDFVKVHYVSQAPSDGENSCQARTSPSLSASKKTKSRQCSNMKAKSKKKKPQQRGELTKKLEYKVQHSKQLTMIHDEAEAQFKAIRQRLNNLVIERSRPKTRISCTRKKEPYVPSVVETNPLKEGIVGKGGKSRYVIQVGEVQNLYKTTKPSLMHQISLAPLSTLDLHGSTREEALVKLDERLNVWFDAAMRGSYPFVKLAVIVCGCGSQTLSETVQDWIKSNGKVSNAPQRRSSR